MKRKIIATVLSVAMGASCLFAFAACKQSEESSLWTMEKVYAEAVDLGYEGTLEELIALFKGETGETGADGVGIDNIALNTNGELIITLSNGNMINVGSVTGAQGEQGVQGEQGKDGATWLLGEGAPSADNGKDGDMYMNTLTFEIFRKTDGVWTLIGSIKGNDGDNGKDGTDGISWQFGSGVPTADLGKVGDFYLDNSTFDVYQKSSLGWVKIGSIKGADGEQGAQGTPGEQGAQGAQGAQGEDGKNGEDGATWLLGEGAPSADNGKNGDMYMDTTTYTIYQKAEGEWASVGSIKGEQGESNSVTDISVKATYDEDENIVYTFTFTFENGDVISTTAQVTAPATVVSFELNTKIYSVIGEDEEAPNIDLIVYYSDGTVVRGTVTEDMITEGSVDFTKAGSYTITVTYKGCTQTLTILVL